MSRLRRAAVSLLLVLGVVVVPAGSWPAGAQSGSGVGSPPVLVVALGSSLSDVGTAASLVAAGVGDAVVFAESVRSLGDAAEELIEARAPEVVYIVGGTAAVGTGVERQLRRLAPGVAITRFAGASRIHTAALAAEEALAGRRVSKIIIANGWSLPDVGAAASAVAAGAADAVLYAEPRALGEPTQRALEEYLPSTVLIAGGEAALSARVQAAAVRAAGDARATRLGGRSRIETAALIAQEALPRGADTVVVADGWSSTGVGIAAALAAATPNSAVLYAATGDSARSALNSAIRSLAPDRIVLIDIGNSIDQSIPRELSRHGSFTRINSPIVATRVSLDNGQLGDDKETGAEESEDESEKSLEPVLPSAAYMAYIDRIGAFAEACGFWEGVGSSYANCDDPADNEILEDIKSDFLTATISWKAVPVEDSMLVGRRN